MNRWKLFLIGFFCSSLVGYSQNLPSPEENIPFLVTFSKQAAKTWGDDDFVQIYFISVPTTRTEPIYIRVFDPDVGGEHDEDKGGFNSTTKFSVYGGKEAHSHPDAKKQDPSGNFKSGVILASKSFSNDKEYDNAWYSFGPFNPAEGELQPDYGGYVFKVVVEGLSGDDGNLYKMALSSKKDINSNIEGGNAFTYEYCFRTYDKPGSISHIYPFVPTGVISIKIHTFDYDDEGIIRVVSVAKKGELAKTSQDGNWVISEHKIVPEELNTSLDIQLIKKAATKNNNMVLYVTNQYGELLPFYASPIGGIPKFKYKIIINKTN
jgi:hypothetical protein